MFTVLFTSVGRRVELVQAFKNSYQKQNLPARIIGVDANPKLAPAGYYTDAVFQVPRVSENGYIEQLIEICSREKVSLLIPLYEPEFLILNQYQEKIIQCGTILLLSKRDTLEICADKFKTFCFFKEHSFRTPNTWLACENTIKKIPCFTKPLSGMGSVGAQKVESQAHLDILLNQNRELIFQDYISGIEYTLDVLADFNGQIISVVPRERMEVRSGEVIKSRTVKRWDLIDEAKKIAETLGAIGPITIQCIDDGQNIYWIEINPRFGGGVPLSIAAGVDYPQLLLEMSRRKSVKPIVGEFIDNLIMLRYDQSIFIP